MIAASKLRPREFRLGSTRALPAVVALSAAALASAAGAAAARGASTPIAVVVALAAFVVLAAPFGPLEAAVLLCSLALPVYEVGWLELFGSSVGLFTLVVLALVTVTLVCARHQWGAVVRQRASWAVIAFAAAVCFSLAVAPRTDLSTHLAKTYVARTLALPLALAVAVAAAGRIGAFIMVRRAMTAVVAIGVAGSVLAIVQVGGARGYLAPPATKVYVDQFIGVRAIGLSEAPGTWGAFLLLPLAAAVAALLRRASVVWMAVLLVLLLGIEFSGLRSAWVAAGVTLLGLAGFTPTRVTRRVAPVALAACSVVVALQFANFQSFLGGAGSAEVRAPGAGGAAVGPSIGGGESKAGAPLPTARIGAGRLAADESLRFRYHITRAELELGKRHPVAGVGLGNLGFALRELPRSFTGPGTGLVPGVPVEKHNTYAGLFAELGIPGALAFVAVVVAGFMALVQVRRAVHSSASERALVDGLIGALAATALVAGATEADRQVFLWWILGIATGLRATVGNRSRYRRSRRGKWRLPSRKPFAP